MPIDLDAALALAEQLARRAGALLLDGLSRPREVHYKGAVDLVTEFDRKSEALITAAIRAAYPDHHIVGEEGGGQGAPVETAPYRWYIDPLDGTANYAHGIPYFSVSIALSSPDDVPLVGLVYDPSRDECFRAARGRGAWRNGQPIHVSAVADLAHAALVSGFPLDRRVNPDNNLDKWSNFLVRTQSLSRMGSAALNLSYVAAGRFDGFWEMRINPWDVQAGLLLVEEAGGRITNFTGQLDGVYRGRELVTSNGLIHAQMLTVLERGDQAPRPDRSIER